MSLDLGAPRMAEAQRSLTDADVEAIAAVLEKRLVSRFYGNLGRGVWAWAWKLILIVIIGLAAAGALKSGGFTIGFPTK